MTRPACELLIAPKLGLVTEPLGLLVCAWFQALKKFTAELQLQALMNDEVTLQGQIRFINPRSVQREARRVTEGVVAASWKAAVLNLLQIQPPMNHGLTADILQEAFVKNLRIWSFLAFLRTLPEKEHAFLHASRC